MGLMQQKILILKNLITHKKEYNMRINSDPKAIAFFCPGYPQRFGGSGLLSLTKRRNEKVKKKLFTGLVIGLLGVALVSVDSQAKASDYIGDFCWQLVQTNGDSYGGTVKFSAFSMGGGWFTILGPTGMSASDPNYPIIEGHVKIAEGNKYIMTWTEIGRYGDKGSYFGKFHATLDGNLNGTFRGNDTDVEEGWSNSNGEYIEGTLTRCSCP